MTDRIPGAPGRYQAQFADGELAGKEFTVTLRRDDNPITEGTPYNKANVLPDALAVQLCPELPDPAPKDAFNALQNQKADTGRKKSGNSITLKDAANAPLLGLRIFGHDRIDDNGEVHIVGDKGSVTVKVTGKNLADVQKFSANSSIATPNASTSLTNAYGTTITPNADGTVTVTQSKYSGSGGSYQNGFFSVGFYCPLKVGDIITISFDYEVTDNPKPSNLISVFLHGQGLSQSFTTSSLRKYTTTVTESMLGVDNWNYIELRIDGKSGVFSNFQIEYGSQYTGFEPFKEVQTITVPTPGGLVGGSGVYDEIDFAKGVLIQRIREQSETPLPEDVLVAYANLRTYAQTTIITNDEGADMEVRYCTPNTAVLVSQDQQGQWLHEELEGDPGEGAYKKLGSGILVAHGNFRCGVIGMLPEISGPEDYRLQSAIRFPSKFSIPPVVTVLMTDSGNFDLTDFKITKVTKDYVEFEMKSKTGRDVYAEISVSAIGTWK